MSSQGFRVFRCPSLSAYSGQRIGVHFEWLESEAQAMFARLLQSLTLTRRVGERKVTNTLVF